MYNKFLFLIIVIFIIIITIILIYYSNNELIEKFTQQNVISAPFINFPALSNTAEITLLYPNNNATVNTNKAISIREKYSALPENISMENLSFNGYGITYIQSSFNYRSEANRNSCISALINSNITLELLSFSTVGTINNYIKFILPDRIQFRELKITIGGLNDTYKTKIFVYAFNIEDNKMYKIKTNSIITGEILTLSVLDNAIITFDNLIIFFDKSLTTIILKNIKILGYAVNSPTTIQADKNSNLEESESVNVFTDNINSQFSEINTSSSGSMDDAYEKKRDINTTFNLILLNNNPPWGIYSAADITKNNDISKLNDLLGRECKKADIIGPFTVTTETPKTGTGPGMKYIKGTIQTNINFPRGSLPDIYTICVVTKYDNNVNRNRILTTSPIVWPNWLLGHWGNTGTGIAYNDGWLYHTWTPDENPSDWRICCVKSTANNYTYNLIINGVNKSWRNGGGNYNRDAILTINNPGYPWESSDFGFSYLIIWDYVLSDSELLIVSNTLTNYVNTGVEPSLEGCKELITITDGLTEETAGRSAYDIKLASCTNTNGIYWIRRDKYSKPFKIYCIMDSNFYGGGWMLAMKGANTGSDFTYNSSHWKNESLLNETDYPTSLNDRVNKSSKYDIFNYYKVSSCLAIFDEADTGASNTDFCKGWVWYNEIFYDGSLSLKDFYAQGKEQFVYYSSGNHDFGSGKDRRYVKSQSASDFTSYILNGVYNEKVWARQEQFQAYGFNINPYGHRHAVRWGGTFNENHGGVPDSNDVSGGIGVEAQQWNAGNVPICCESRSGVRLKQMGFKWYIK